MAKRAKRRATGTSLKPIIREINKARGKIAGQLDRATSAVTVRRLELKLRRLDAVEARTYEVCRSMGLYVR